MQQFEFQLNLSEDDVLAYYRGAVREVLARTSTGQVIQFPAALLKPLVTSTGVHGRFRLTCTDEHKGGKLVRLG